MLGLSLMLDVIRKVDADFPASHLAILVELSRHPGLNQVEIHERTGIIRANLSRYVSRLGDWKYKNTAKEVVTGYGFLTAVPDPNNRRSIQLFLTDKGERFLKNIKDSMSSK